MARSSGDDIVHEVCIRLFEHARTIREPRSLLSWLAMVTRRAASQVGRRTVKLVPTELDDNAPSQVSTEDQAMRTGSVARSPSAYVPRSTASLPTTDAYCSSSRATRIFRIST